MRGIGTAVALAALLGLAACGEEESNPSAGGGNESKTLTV